MPLFLKLVVPCSICVLGEHKIRRTEVSLDIDQATADSLLAMTKRRSDNDIRKYPSLGGKLIVPLVSCDQSEEFMFDINESTLSLAKVTYQTRARTSVILARLDIAGAPHRNPDDTEVGVPHLHLYREGFGDKWAVEVPMHHFRDLTDKRQTVQDFLDFCNVIDHPDLRLDLFV